MDLEDAQQSFPMVDSQTDGESTRFTNDQHTKFTGKEIEFLGIKAEFFLVSPTEERAVDAMAKADDDVEGTDDNSVACDWDGTTWVCQPYNRKKIYEDIVQANLLGLKGEQQIMKLLENEDVRVFIVDSKVSSSLPEVMSSIRGVIRHVSKQDRSLSSFNPREAKRCILYKDKNRNYFNLTMAEHTTAPASSFKSHLGSFSGVQAVSVLLVLVRSIACIVVDMDPERNAQPWLLSVLLGVVFVEEISYSWINVAMFVRGLPSISAYSITTYMETDWLRKTLVFCMALAGFTTGLTQVILSTLGIALAVSVLLANLGARAWGHLHWRPLVVGGVFENVIAYFAAMVAGILVPYLAHKEVLAGGKTAMESVVKTAIVAAFVFVLSDHYQIQELLVVGNQDCNQTLVNIVVGVWFAVSMQASLFMAARIHPPVTNPLREEALLKEDQASPVGFKIPALPDFPIDPIFQPNGRLCCSFQTEFVFGVSAAVVIGAVVIYISLTIMQHQTY